MTIKHFRSETAYSAFADFDQRFRDHFEACEQFAARFNAAPIVITNPLRVSFHGVILSDWPDRDDAALWRKPDPKAGGRQEPKTGRGIPKNREEEAEALAAAWRDAPADLDRSKVWQALGIDWARLFLHDMAHHIDHANRCLWIKTRIEIAPEYAEEVLGSEYENAVAAIEAAEQGES